jgi:hypothetical protein
MPMIRFLQKFDQLPKLRLGGELGGASINGKFAELTAPTQKRDLYLITFHPCQSVSECLPSCIEGVLMDLNEENLQCINPWSVRTFPLHLNFLVKI